MTQKLQSEDTKKSNAAQPDGRLYVLQWFKYTGIWPSDPKQSWQSNIFIVISMIMNGLDLIAKIFFNHMQFSPEEVQLMEVLDFSRLVFSKTFLFTHHCVLIRHRREFYKFEKFLLSSRSANGKVVLPTNFIITTCLAIVRILLAQTMHWLLEYTPSRVYFSFSKLYYEWMEMCVLSQFIYILTNFKIFLVRINADAETNKFHLSTFDWIVRHAENVNTLYGVQLLVIIVQIFIVILNQSYNSVRIFYCLGDNGVRCPEDDPYSSDYPQLSSLYSILSYLFLLNGLGVLIYIAQTVSNEINAFSKNVFRAMRKYPHIRNNSQLQLYIMMNPQIQFTAYDFFKIGFPLATSIIAGVATYLVVLVEFGLK